MIENYTNGGMVRKSPPHDFLFIFGAILCKMIRSTWINFDRQVELTEKRGFWKKK